MLCLLLNLLFIIIKCYVYYILDNKNTKIRKFLIKLNKKKRNKKFKEKI